MSDFASEAAQLALRDLEENVIQAERQYQDAQRYGDPASAADALKSYAAAKREYDTLSGANQPRQQPSGQLSNAQMNFLSRRAALGDEITPKRMQDYALAHTRAVNAGLTPDSPEYFKAVERSVDTQGDGRQPLLDERSVAKMCGISDEEYAAQATKLAAMKARGDYT
jgi:hypothetical protein